MSGPTSATLILNPPDLDDRKALARTDPQEARPISYWTSLEGQERIDSFGGWEDSRALSTFLALTYPQLYGSEAGSDNLWGQYNRGVAAFVQVTELIHGPDSEPARKLAEALDEYDRVAARAD